MMTISERTVTYRGIILAAACVCALLVSSCNGADQLLPPEGSPPAHIAGQIYYTRSDAGDVDRIMKYEAGTSVPITPGVLASAPQLGHIAYYNGSGPGDAGVYLRDLTTGKEQILSKEIPTYATINPETVTLAPDGQTVAFIAVNFSELEVHIVSPISDAPFVKDIVTIPYGIDPSRTDMLYVWFDAAVSTVLVAGISKFTGGELMFAVNISDETSFQLIDFSDIGLDVTGIDFSPISFQMAMTTGSQGLIISDYVSLSPTDSVTPGYGYASPRWSPDETNIAFTAPAGVGTGDIDLYTADSAGDKVQRITNTSDYEQYPVWNTEGTSLLYTSVSDPVPASRQWATGKLLATNTSTKETIVIDNDVYRGFWVTEQRP